MSSKKKLLLVENNPGDIMLTELALDANHLSYDLTTVDSGNDGLDYIYKREKYQHIEGYPDLILLDLNMPGIHGKEFLKIIRQDDNIPNIPIVILTTSTSDKEKKECLVLGASSFLIKSMDFDEFVADIGTLVGFFHSTVLKVVKNE